MSGVNDDVVEGVVDNESGGIDGDIHYDKNGADVDADNDGVAIAGESDEFNVEMFCGMVGLILVVGYDICL